MRFRHIALVGSCMPPDGGRHQLELAEGGQAGGTDTHHRTLDVKFETSWRNPERLSTPLVSFEHTGKQGLDHRIVRDHAPLTVLPYRGWDMAGQWGV